MATQSFMKNFTVRRRHEKDFAKIINSKKKTFFGKDFTEEPVPKDKIKDFLGVELNGEL